MFDKFIDSKMVCIDPNRYTNKIAREIFAYAGVTKRVKLFDGVLSYFSEQMEKLDIHFSHVFLDHNKKEYLNDLKLLEKHNIIRPKTMLFANNVVIFSIKDYLNYVNNSDQYNNQKLYCTNLEYTDEHKDGVHICYKS